MSKLNFIKLNIQRFAVQDDNTILKKADLKAYHEEIAPFLGGNYMMRTNTSDFYSTDEKVIGIWTNGKPLYQKLVYITAMPNSTETKIVPHGISNLESIRRSEPLTWTTFISDGYQNTVNTFISVDTTNVYLRNYGQDKSSWAAYVLLQYTKTTDTATSALTTPGAYDINFPTTWPANKEIFFGNGLYGYRATGNFSATTIGSEFHRDMPVIPTTSRLINSGGNFTVGGYSDFNVGLGPTYSSTQLVISSCLFLNNGGIPRFRVMTFHYGLTTSDTYDIWFTYTK